MNEVYVDKIPIGAGHPLVLISGPCVVESDDVMLRTAQGLAEICTELELPLIFKSSYEKDNRSHRDAPRGPGLEAGLATLARVRSDLGLPVTSDVHRVSDVAPAAEILDLVQIPALLCRQTSLLEAAGRCGRPVNLKKGQFLGPRAMAGALEKVRGVGSAEVLLTERGSSFGYERLVCDLTSIPIMQGLGAPVVLDAGHGANNRRWIPLLAQAGVAAGADALFIECHPDPAAASCDGARMLSLQELRTLLAQVVPLARQVREPAGADQRR